MLTLNNLHITRPGLVLKPLSLTLFAGACASLTGPNGSGKSTAIKTLATLIRPQPGSILVHGIDVLTSLEEYRSLFCYISDTPTIDLEMTVLDNLLLWANLYQRELALSATLMGFGLVDVADQTLASLSRGMQCRVQLARLLLSNAIIWFLDEPFVHLDQQTAEYTANLISIKCRNGGIVVLSSHQSLELLPSAITIKLEELAYE